MSEPYLRNPQQDKLAELPIVNVLAIAPAGCGKTEALALRARAVISRGEVATPRIILALTFSNKARDNLAGRMRKVVGPAWRQRISVANFHGLSARIVMAHGNTIGLAPNLILPEETWIRRQHKELGIDFKNSAAFEAALQSAKRGPFDDDEVMDRLRDTGNDAAVLYEEQLREACRLDYDDLLRHASRLLQNPAVSRLYRAHFGMVMVDEVQDLSLMQYDIVRALGGNGVTYVGDPAQGIYSFAGADPEGVIERIRNLSPEIVEFSTSYRSSPAVLAAVNVLGEKTGSTGLMCGCPEKWPDGGQVIYLERSDSEQEAAALLNTVSRIIDANARATIGIVGRRSARMDYFRKNANDAGVSFEDWSQPTHVPQVVELLKRHLREATMVDGDPEVAVDELERLCRESLDPADVTTADELARAIDELKSLIAAGTKLRDAVGNCRRSSAPDAPVSPGLHLLTGHRGKGQEFDWVIVIGMESGHVPDFRNEADPEEFRILHVMVSRARYGLIFTYSRQTTTRYGWRPTIPSKWLSLLRSRATITDIE
jgi:DNA helicase-2/ATP-dependent DNA helicase PcrA